MTSCMQKTDVHDITFMIYIHIYIHAEGASYALREGIPFPREFPPGNSLYSQ